jgi:hypothetical protein
MLERDMEMRGDLSPAHVRGLEAMMKAVNAEKYGRRLVGGPAWSIANR